MKNIVLAVSICFSVLALKAQDNAEFKPSGKPVVKVFTNWHQGFGDETYSDISGFEISRAVLGYSYQFSPLFYSKVIVDMDNPKAGKLTEVAYLRNAYLAYKDDRLNVVFGILGMKQFKEQESNWGYRYIYKSAMDHYSFNSSVDAGLYVQYKLMDCLSADITVSNGEGAKKQQDIEGKYRLGGGLSFSPLDNFSFRAYYDYFFASDDYPANKDLQTLALFAGYETEKFRLGVEYDRLQNYAFDAIDDREILSLYASTEVMTDMQIFGRYDRLLADKVLQSEDVFIAGVDYSITKGVKISPNFRYINYTDTSQKDGGYVYFNIEFKF